MTKIGLIGGTGPESTIKYYQKINHGYQEKNQTDHFPYITIESINNNDMLQSVLQNDLSKTTDLLLKAANNLQKAGADVVTLTGITPHIVFESLQQKAAVPLVNMMDIIADYCVEKKYKKTLLLGTIVTMTNPFFSNVLTEHTITVVLPSDEQKQFIASKILNELEHGIIHSETKKQFIDLINQHKNVNNIDSVILGCTELPLLLGQKDFDIPIIDPVDIHVNYLLDHIIQ